MSFLAWNPYLETGIEIVDRQHRGLVDLLNQAAPLLAQSSQESLKDIGPLLDKLVAYAATHFKTEEEMMARLRMDPRATTHHHASHAMFARKVGDMAQAFSSDAGVTGDRLLSFLASWLVLHILGEDQAMARQVREIEAGVEPALAYARGRGSETHPHPAALSHALVDIYTTLTQQNRELDASRAEIQRHNANLEHLVRERTARLEQLAEDLRHARDAAEAGSRAKTRFLGTMSHELRTPMNAILGYSRLLRDTDLPATEQNLARRIVDAADRLLELIDGVMEYARLDDGQVPLREEDFSPRALLLEAGRHACALAAEKGLSCEHEVDPALPAVLHGDAGLIARVLARFADNAAKFTRHGGIRLCVQRLDGAVAGRFKLRFLVEDSGIGIAPEDQARLFKPFSQVDDRTDRQFEGIGLGLALAQRWAGMLGGDVGVESIPGKGSSFWLELVLAGGQAAVATAPADASEPMPAPERLATPPHDDALPVDLLASLEQIDALLRAFDTRAGSALRVVAPRLRRYFGAQVDELDRLITAFDYDQALERLKAFIQEGESAS